MMCIHLFHGALCNNCKRHLIHPSETLLCSFGLTAGVQVELHVCIPCVSGNAAAVCAALPPRKSSLPADGEEG